MDSSTYQSLNDHIELQVKIGYNSREDIIASAIEMFKEDFEDNFLLRRLALRLTDSSLATHYIAQRTWNHVTDCDKLDEAFAELDRLGIVARQNYTCCQTCGHTEIGYELGKTSVHRQVRGYVFFHQGDSEQIIGTDNLYLAYGAVMPDGRGGTDEASVAVGHEVVRVLKKHGLAVEWNGLIQKRIRIKDIHWQRRRLPISLSE